MIVPIYTYGEEILTKRSEEIDLNDPTLPELIQNMYDTMRNTNLSIAISAPQIGVSKRVFIVDVDEEEFGTLKGVFINPKILSTGEYNNGFFEPCLSFPSDVKFFVKRPTIVELEWYDENKNYNKKFINELMAKVVQHEMDHLDGVLLTDKTTESEIKNNQEKLDNHLKKKSKFIYPVFNYLKNFIVWIFSHLFIN